MAHEDTPAGRVAAAVAGKPAHAYATVRASDVVALGAEVQTHTAVTSALALGAKRALDERVAATDPDSIEVFQVAGQLAHLLEVLAGEPVPESP